MPNSRRGFLKAAGTAGAGVLALPAVARAQQVHRWKAQSLWSAAELTYKVFQDFCERVKKLTAGRLEITPGRERQGGARQRAHLGDRAFHDRAGPSAVGVDSRRG